MSECNCVTVRCRCLAKDLRRIYRYLLKIYTSSRYEISVLEFPNDQMRFKLASQNKVHFVPRRGGKPGASAVMRPRESCHAFTVLSRFLDPIFHVRW